MDVIGQFGAEIEAAVSRTSPYPTSWDVKFYHIRKSSRNPIMISSYLGTNLHMWNACLLRVRHIITQNW